MRTNYCGLIDVSYIGQEITLQGLGEPPQGFRWGYVLVYVTAKGLYR